ncbi:MAG: ParB/RepB/Spo0J family partition protein [Verrucomicrobiales bacterium]|jgi:ParB family chromosome partitioning protein|nr:ParB/RepB/Spo0J family partition protein [Verrucomicrobiales bacterium]
MSRNALGKGLGALIGARPVVPGVVAPLPDAAATAGEQVREVGIDEVRPGDWQPRKSFDEAQLTDLAASIKENGIIQPLLVRQTGGQFEIIAGERRWRAAQRAGLARVPVLVRQAADLEALELALVENLQRSDLNPIEEAEGYGNLAEKFNLTQEQVAQKVGKSRAAVANATRLLGLQADVREMVRHGHLSVGHAKVLLGLADGGQQDAAAREVVKRGLSVRETEQLVARCGKPRRAGVAKGSGKAVTSDWRDLEQRLQRVLGAKVRLIGTAAKGRLEIDYYNESDLERLLETLGVSGE